MLVRGVINDELGDDANAARVRGIDEPPHVGHRAVTAIDLAVLADVVAAIE
jgi:hypothetical protein